MKRRFGRPARVACAGAFVAGLVLGLAACADEPVDPKPTPTKTTPSTTAPATPTPDPEPTVPPEPSPPAFDLSVNSIDDPMSLWVISNKLRPLNPMDFEPTDLTMPIGVGNQNGQPLREPAARAVESMIAAANTEGLPVTIISAYRDYNTQVGLYNGYIARDGQAAADTYSARPGHSEHQTGLVVDLDDGGGCYLEGCFGDTASGAWLAAHAAEYGFIVRYPTGKDSVTGFMPEPWHFRYVGPELAAEMAATGVVTLEEMFGLPPAPTYAG